MAEALSTRPVFTERDVAAAWNDGAFRGPYQLPDGRTVEVIHRGAWTHGFGPDFRDAIIAFDRRALSSGSVEIHLRTSGWRAHGHHLDSRYNDVVLHLVVDDDGAETRTQAGALIPVLKLPAEAVDKIQPRGEVDWTLVGGTVCAEALSKWHPSYVRELIRNLGDIRLAAKVAKIEAQLEESPPAEVLYGEVLEALGFSSNRQPMRALSRRLPISAIEAVLGAVSPANRLATARGLLFGTAGFLPMAALDAAALMWPFEQTQAAEDAWREFGGPWFDATMPPTAWSRSRSRPANHPALRIATAAAMIAFAEGGLTAFLISAAKNRDDIPAALKALSERDGTVVLGSERASAIAVNAVIPFALALAEHASDYELGEAASELWDAMPGAEANEITRRAMKQVAGKSKLPNMGARGLQGLIHLDQALCSPRRCFECPIAAAVLLHGPPPVELKART